MKLILLFIIAVLQAFIFAGLNSAIIHAGCAGCSFAGPINALIDLVLLFVGLAASSLLIAEKALHLSFKYGALLASLSLILSLIILKAFSTT